MKQESKKKKAVNRSRYHHFITKAILYLAIFARLPGVA